MFVAKNLVDALATIIDYALWAYMWAFILRAVLSWVSPDPYNPIVRGLYAVTALSGSGPAYAFLFLEALADGAVRAGMGRAEASLLAASTLEGAARMVRETGKHPAELKDMVMSPGGTTAAGVAALERGAFRATVMDAVLSAWQRCRELSG